MVYRRSRRPGRPDTVVGAKPVALALALAAATARVVTATARVVAVTVTVAVTVAVAVAVAQEVAQGRSICGARPRRAATDAAPSCRRSGACAAGSPVRDVLFRLSK